MSKVTWVDAPETVKEVETLSVETKEEVTIEDLFVETETTNALEILATETITDTVPEGFEWLLEDDIASPDEIINEGLEIPKGVKELASKIETKMQELYGQILPYNYKETSKYCVVTINNTNEVFYI
jgi:hypothetical protein